jgi:hypothetical protein
LLLEHSWGEYLKAGSLHELLEAATAEAKHKERQIEKYGTSD